MKALLLAHVAATLTMFGVILVVQVVHYPLFGKVGAPTYVDYQAAHMQRITVVVLPAMAVELLTAAGLVWWRPFGLPAWLVWTGLVLVILIWASTGLIQAPLHQSLAGGFDAALHRRLVATNWLRTALWTLRAALVLWMLARVLDGTGNG